MDKNLDKLEELKKLAEANDGKLLTKEWLGSEANYQFEYNDGRIFERNLKRLREKNGWPQDLDKFFKLSNANKSSSEDFLKTLQEEAKNNNCILLSSSWLGRDKKHIFKFINDDRTFERTYNKIKQEGWPKNAENYFKMIESQNKNGKQFLDEMKLVAEKNKGKLISIEWKGAFVKNRFIFEDGREFEISYNNLMNNKNKENSWPQDPDLYFKLSATHKITPEEHLEEFKILVKSALGAELLENTWLGNNEKHRILKNNKEELVIPKYIKSIYK